MMIVLKQTYNARPKTMSDIYKKETKEQRVVRVVTRVVAILAGLFILLLVSTTGSIFEEITIDDITALRSAAMLGFTGWFYVFILTIRPRK